MDARQQRGMELAATRTITKGKQGVWVVPSQAGPGTVETTARNFTISEVSADKAYGSRKNAEAIAAVGGTPFIAYKDSSTGGAGGLFQEMYHFFMYKRQEFLQHYHKRSNVESTFSMMKRKFGDSLRSKTDTAMMNETLCKVLCHNLVVLIHEMHELGIDPVFWGNQLKEVS